MIDWIQHCIDRLISGLPEKKKTKKTHLSTKAKHILVSYSINFTRLICVNIFLFYLFIEKMLQIIALTGELSHRVNLEIGDFDRSTE